MPKKPYRDTREILSHWWETGQTYWPLSITLLLVITVIVLFFPIFYMEKYFHSEESRIKLHLFEQMLTGNWSVPLLPYSKRPIAISLSLSIGIVLHLVTLGVGGFAITYIANSLRKGYNMKPTALYGIRDTVIRAAFELLLRDRKDFSPEQKATAETLLRQAFDNGDEKWNTTYFDQIFPGNTVDKKRKLAKLDI